ncbi:MAG: DDE-type integrase/transposase/recombinase [Candidatus Rokubacteria bacterium]|nr:DDE-type integrase/transposase/recombinase [Candidatus Rokubacteria bacterium]
MQAGTKREYLAAIYGRYRHATRSEKGRILDEFCEVTGYHRKYALRRLNRPAALDGLRRRRVRAATYGPAVIEALRVIWEAAGYPWSVRLKAALPLWLPWARRRQHLSATVCAHLTRISARQIDRRLAGVKRTLKRRQYGRTRPGTLLKHHIPLKTDHWDVTTPGFTELDLVAHCGSRADGEFAHSLNVTDIHTTWVETRAVLGKSEIAVQQALEAIRQVLPFRLRGIDSDNGSEFINNHLYRYCQAQEIQFTRGRPYKKDDNAHIEQKNWTHVRKLVGYGRYDTPAALAALNDLYAHELGLLQNLFLPSVKLVRKERIGARVRRRYDAPRTPLERVQACPEADPVAVARLLALRARLDPFALAATVDRKIDHLVDLAARPARPPVSGVPAPQHRAARRDFTFANHLRRPPPRRASVTS